MRRVLTPISPKANKVIINSHSKNAQQISADVEAFLNKGGKVENIDQGVTGFDDLHTPKTYENCKRTNLGKSSNITKH